MRLETFGTTPQGRKMVAAIVTKDGAQLSADKPVFLIQAGIHSGEIDGKDAGLMLIRDICFKRPRRSDRQGQHRVRAGVQRRRA